MPRAQISPVALLATVAAVGVMLVFSATGNRGYGYETTIAGITLLVLLFAYDEEGYRSALQGVAFAAVAGFCAMLALGYPELALMQPKSPEQWSAFTWLGTTLLFFAVDRMSASSRESTSMGLTGSTPVIPGSFAPAPAPGIPSVRPAYTPAPVVVAPRAPISAPAPVYQPPPPVYQAPPPVYQAPPPVYQPPPVAPAPVPEVAVAASYVSSEPAEGFSEVAGPAPIAPIPAGREAQIFLNLLGEGLNVLRSVKAEHLGRDYYRIADIMPDNERWEYEPNQVVRCRKKALSNGKHLVAFEEAPRA